MTPYISIDIETTGLDWGYCQVLEFGAVIDDWMTLMDELPRFHCYLVHDKIVGEPFALSMHANILRRIANREDGYTYLRPHELGYKFAEFIVKQGLDPGKVQGAGKNFASFDRQFLLELPRFANKICFCHRSIDPAMLYWNPSLDETPPSTKTCMDRAGIPGEVAHTAVEDALCVIKMVRAACMGRPADNQAGPIINEFGKYDRPTTEKPLEPELHRRLMEIEAVVLQSQSKITAKEVAHRLAEGFFARGQYDGQKK